MVGGRREGGEIIVRYALEKDGLALFLLVVPGLVSGLVGGPGSAERVESRADAVGLTPKTNA
jgi:hypothetical protein